MRYENTNVYLRTVNETTTLGEGPPVTGQKKLGPVMIPPSLATKQSKDT